MRTFCCVLSAALAVLLAGTAQANSIALIWQGTGNAVTTQASSASVTADIVLTISSTNITSVRWDIVWDDELAYTTTQCSVSFGNWITACSSNFPTSGSPGRSQGTSPGNQGRYGVGGNAGQNMSTGTATVGTITFHVNANVAADGPPGSGPAGIGSPAPGDVSPSFLNTVDGQGCFAGPSFCTGSLSFSGASVDPIPEPGTLALLMLGLAGLGRVGLGSRGSRAGARGAAKP